MARVEKIEEIPEVRVVRTSFWYEDDDGCPRMLREGATVREGHPIIHRYPEMFWPANHVDLEWETR